MENNDLQIDSGVFVATAIIGLNGYRGEEEEEEEEKESGGVEGEEGGGGGGFHLMLFWDGTR